MEPFEYLADINSSGDKKACVGADGAKTLLVKARYDIIIIVVQNAKVPQLVNNTETGRNPGGDKKQAPTKAHQQEAQVSAPLPHHD